MAKAKFAKVERDVDAMTVRIKWVDDTTTELCLREVTDSIVAQMALHGAVQKMADAYNTKAESLDEAKMIAQGMVAMFMRGEWSNRAEGAGTMLAQAVARVKDIDIGTAKAKVAQLEAADRKKLEKVPAIMAAKAAIMAERAQAAGEAAEDADAGLSILD